MAICYDKDSVPRARELRCSQTRHEAKLWYHFLNSYYPRFQRQKPIGCYIVDFYCHKAKLIVELDGSQHYEEEGLAYDKRRTAVLERYHLEVLRFSNLDIDRNFTGVCQAIDRRVKERMDERE